jgi:acyl carrier protein
VERVVDEIATRGLIARQLGLSPSLLFDTVQFRKLGVDSLDLACLIMRIESTFGLEISEAEAEHCITVGDALALIRRGPPSARASHRE